MGWRRHTAAKIDEFALGAQLSSPHMFVYMAIALGYTAMNAHFLSKIWQRHRRNHPPVAKGKRS